MIELSKMAWSPVLELLGREVRFEELDARPYPLEDRIGDPLISSQRLSRLAAERSGHHRVRWLTAGNVIRVHDEMIATFGGERGIINRGRIESALELSFESPIAGHDPFPTIIDKAASLLHSILLYHPFVDGQKRTGLSCAFILLGVNGFFMWSRDPADEVHFAIHVARGRFEVEQIARWIAARVAPPDFLEDPRVVTRLLPYAQRGTRACSGCHRMLRLDSYAIKCPSCGAKFHVILNAALDLHQRGESRLFVQAGLRRAAGRIPLQRTLEDYLARPEGSLRRLGRGQSVS
jgi:death-on-curing protein